MLEAVRKWETLAATKVKMSGSAYESEQENVQQILHKTCSWEVSRYSRAKQRQGNVQKKFSACAKLLFC